MFIGIEKILKRVTCVLLAVAVVVLGVKYVRKNRVTANNSISIETDEATSLKQEDHDITISKISDRKLSLEDYSRLINRTTFTDNDWACDWGLRDRHTIYLFHGCEKHTLDEAKEVGFSDTEIFGEYKRDEIVKAYGDADGKLSDDILQQIKDALGNFWKFKFKGYTAEEARRAKFDDTEIFGGYKRDEIVKEYGDAKGELSDDILQQIKVAVDYSNFSFIHYGYTAEEARRAKFDDTEIFELYKRDEIVKAYGDEKGKLSDDILRQIKDALGDVWKFKGYTAEEARRAKFDDSKIFREYKRDEIVKAYGDAKGELSDDILQQIKVALRGSVFGFKVQGYTAEEARRAGFSDTEIFELYKRDEIVKVYGNEKG